MVALGGEADTGRRHGQEGFHYNAREEQAAVLLAILSLRGVSTKVMP